MTWRTQCCAGSSAKAVESSGIVSNGRAESQNSPEMTEVMRATSRVH